MMSSGVSRRIILLWYDCLVVGIGAFFFFFICHHALLLHAGLISDVPASSVNRVIYAKGTLGPGRILSRLIDAGNYLESSNTQYMLKFIQQPGGSTFSSWYLCIQSASNYLGVMTPEDITIWVGWQGQGDMDISPDLYMSEEGQLIIRADKDFIVNIEQPSYVENTAATLLDNGNLVLRSGGRTLWQSFDYPANTWVPGMKLGWFGLKTPQPYQRFLTSWTNQQNPSPGAFTFGVLYPNNTNTKPPPPQLVLMRGGIVYWQSGAWNGNNFPFLQNDGLGLNFSYFSDDNETYFILNKKYDDYVLIYTLIHASGNVTVESHGVGRLHTFSSDSFIDCYNSETSSDLDEGCVRFKKSNCSVGDNDWFNSTTGFIDEWGQFLNNSVKGWV